MYVLVRGPFNRYSVNDLAYNLPTFSIRGSFSINIDIGSHMLRVDRMTMRKQRKQLLSTFSEIMIILGNFHISHEYHILHQQGNVASMVARQFKMLPLKVLVARF